MTDDQWIDAGCPRNATYKFRWSAGIIVAGTINSSLRQIAFETDVDLTIKKLGGFFIRDYGGTAVGDEIGIKAFAATVGSYMRRSIEVLSHE